MSEFAMNTELLYSAIFDLHESTRLCREVLDMPDSTPDQRDRAVILMDANVKRLAIVESRIARRRD